MRWTSFEACSWRLPTPHQLQRPTLLHGAYALLHGAAHHLQHHEGEQHEADMAHHRLIHSALARLQSRMLLGVAKERLDGPAAHLALYDACKIGSQVVGD